MTTASTLVSPTTPLDPPVGACTCKRAATPHRSLKELLSVRSGGGAQSCQWELATLDASDADAADEVACIVADGAMQWRCRGAAKSYELWRDAVVTGQALTALDSKRVTPFIRTVFGLPAKPAQLEHLCGWIAEYLWFRLAQETTSRPSGTVRRIEGPNFHATAPGGDGFVVWERASDGSLTFCLWEIKNYVGSSGVTGTIGRAYGQLQEKATEYLAKLTTVSAAAEDGTVMGQLYADLVNLWVDGSDRSGAGVAVGTHHANAPGRCFTTIGTHFPALTGPTQMQGLIAAIARFDDLALDIQRRVWTAL